MTDKRKDEMKKYTLDDDGDYEWVVDPETGEGMSPQKICDILNTRSATPPVPDAVTVPREVVQGVREALDRSYTVFKNYKYMHLQKVPPDTVKADKNDLEALKCHRALASLDAVLEGK